MDKIAELITALSSIGEADLEGVRLFRAHSQQGFTPDTKHVDRDALVSATTQMISYRDRCEKLYRHATQIGPVPSLLPVMGFGL